LAAEALVSVIALFESLHQVRYRLAHGGKQEFLSFVPVYHFGHNQLIAGFLESTRADVIWFL
jgi:hypothetical protein